MRRLLTVYRCTPWFVLPLVTAAFAVASVGGAQAAARKKPEPQLAATAAPLPASAARSPNIAERAPHEPLVGVVSLARQRITIWQGNRMLSASPISSGQEGYRTPKGVFSIIQKNRYHESNIYDDAPMPFMQRLTWSGIALHAGKLPGYPASHGCVRLPEAFAAQLFGQTKMGMRVIVADHETAPVAITHRNLPAPVLRHAPAPAPISDQPATANARTAVASSGNLFTSAAHAASAPASRPLNPVEVARLEQKRSVGELADAIDAATRLQSMAALAVEAHRHASDDVRRLAGELARAETEAAAARSRIAAARDDESRIQAEASHYAAEEAVAAAQAELQHARVYDADTAEEAMQTALAAKNAFAARDAAEFKALSAARATEPISVFVSRKHRRVYVRQGFEPLLEATVDIADETAPIGTHVFTAIAPAPTGDQLQWTGVAVPETATSATPSSQQALDRVTFSPEVANFVTARVWTGASLIISDHGPSSETGKGTDFVILTQ